MTSLGRLCLASGIALIGLAPALRLPQAGAAHDRTYAVQIGDTLSAIAGRFHVSAWRLARLNGLADPDRLQAGQVLTVPGGWDDTASSEQEAPVSQAPASSSTMQGAGATMPGAGASYVVARGDTLSALSARFGVSLSALAAANGIYRPYLLRIGQRLLIPGRTTAGRSGASEGAGQTAIATSTPVARTGLPSFAPVATSTPATGFSPSASSQTGVGALLSSEAQAYGVDPALVKAVAWQESGWRMVQAADGGIGVMQLMPATAAWVGPALLGRSIDPYNLQDNIQAGVALLASYLRQYGGNVQMALAAYNEGPQNVTRGIASSTAQYIAAVLALRARFAQ